MIVEVLLFAALREHAGQDRVRVALPEGARVATLRQAIAEQHPALASHLGAVRVAIDQRFGVDDDPLAEVTEIALIPPVSGG